MMKCHPSVASVLLAICFLAVFDKVSSCELSWSRFGDHCYRIYPLSQTWITAKLRCILEGSQLVSITDVSILDFLAQHIAHTGHSKFWVGLGREKNDREFEWFDGTRGVKNQSWVKIPEPNEFTNSPEDFFGIGCFAYDGAVVAKATCYERLASICGYPISQKTHRTICNWEVETSHTFIGDSTGNCLFRTPSQTTKGEADRLCQRYRGNLIDFGDMLRDGLTAFYDHKVLSNDGSKYWTRFVWNGTNLFWKTGEMVPKEYPIPVIEGTGSCITVQFNFTDILSTKFYQTDCEDDAYAVCSMVIQDGNSATSTTEGNVDNQDVLMMDDPSLNCPEGYNWKSDRRNSYCYWETSFETDQLSWEDAEKYCQSYGGHLGSFHSAEEEKIGLSFQYGSLAHPYWIGLSLDPETETYNWSDGSALDYSNWARGHPDHKDKRLRCVAMEAQEKHWVSSLCGILSWFICKVPKKVSHVPASIPTPAPLESCEKNPFISKSSYLFQGSCYFAISETFSWHRAKQYCENEGATLVSIHSADEIGFLLRLLHESSMETNRIWIGLNSFGSDGNFHWTDWSPVDFTFFSDNEPNNYQNQEKCCNMYTRNGQWNDENCNAALGFVCKRFKDSSITTVTPSTIDPRIGNCKKGWIAHLDRCYYVGGKREKDRVNWTEALDICQKNEGYLTSIRNTKDQNFLSYLLQTLGVDAWIGLHDTIQSGRYYWLDNSDVQYTNWAPGEPSFFGIMEDCVKMVYDHLDSGVWKDDECQRKMGYICQNNKDPQLPPPPSQRGVNCIHPEGWLKLDTMCFKMFAGNLLKWEDAERACQKDGGHLVSISDQRIKAVVSHLAAELDHPFYIGLRYNKNNRMVRWLNGFPVKVSNWEKNEPHRMTEDSCFASTSEGYWKKHDCDEKLPYVCQITTGKPTKLRQFTGDCPPSSRMWTPGSKSYCYILDNDFRSDWFTANLMCFRYGSHLISVHSLEEIEDLRELIKPGIRSVFLGLMRNKKGGFTWTDDSPVNFVNWDENEPANSEDQCAEMVTSNMRWRVVPCISKKHYVCQDTKSTLVVEEPQSAEFAAAQAGISTAAICAIVFSILILIVLIVAAVLYRRRSSGEAPSFQRHTRNQSISFENALYNVGNASMEFHDEDKS